ncbi:hypothetical protein [Phreatobacter sp.]|uniref:hypothetical protein n=1 Tax=Phreatobacter sp. TaxID=1966341 RepID=UPI003F710296
MALICWPALGQPLEPARRQPFTPGPPVTLPQCTCRAEGRDWTVGQTICLRTTGGERLAICTTDENVTTWRISDVPCASSSLPSPSRLALIRRNLR